MILILRKFNNKITRQYSWSLILREMLVFLFELLKSTSNYDCSRVRVLQELAHVIRFQSLLRSL